MKHVDLAMMDLEEAIKLDASQTEAYLIRGQIYLSQKKRSWQNVTSKGHFTWCAARRPQGFAVAV